MAEQYLIYDDSLSCIGDAIRAKYGDTTKYYPREMPEAIRGIPDAGSDEWWKFVDRTIQVLGDYEGLIYNIHPYAFYGCHQLESIYLLSSEVVSFSIWSSQAGYAFNASPLLISSYLGHYGSVFVPTTLVASYRTARGWSSISPRLSGYNVPTGQRGSESNQYLIYDETLTNIGGAIRERLAEADEYYPRDMPSAIMRIGGSVDACGPIMAGIINGDIESLDDTSGKAKCVGSDAFANVYTLKTINLPECSSISSEAFYWCHSLETATFPECTYVGSYAFDECWALHKVSFPKCISIDYEAFRLAQGDGSSGSLASGTEFPACKTISASAFAGAYCESIKFNTLEIFPSLIEGNFVSIDCPECIEIERDARGDNQSLQHVSFPKCQTIGDSAFYRCYYLSSAIFPECTTIGEYAFASCFPGSNYNPDGEEYSIDFPKCITIGNYAFASCYSLTQVSFPLVETIGGSAFAFCKSLLRASFPLAETIGTSAFWSCNQLSEANFPECIEVGSYAFANVNSVSLSISFPKCKIINTYAFEYCIYLQEAIFPECEEIGNRAFLNCHSGLSIASFDKVSIIGSWAFSSCYLLASLYLPLCEDIWQSAFYRCSSLTTVSLPVVSHVGDGAFALCGNVSEYYFMSESVVELDAAASGTFGGTNSRKFYVPASLLSDYLSASRWSRASSFLVGI